MRLLKLWEVPLCLLPLVIAPAGAQALAVNIQINGTTVPSGNCSTVGNTTTCNIEGTYGSVQVS
ncbi:MAG TPA: hypothetical protein VKP13_14305, partial [Nitrospira sp.]|nr:hypothetical protein [Nitrospira sp.]